ncbi:MAG: lipid-A-disaccharide synthase [Bacteroidaceae bacterium]|nr:lipid-A-disaccharide synthase [Bacteroidaceae bacterium]
MKYYLIAGEASGDLHASHLMRALRDADAEASFRCVGGDLMKAEGATLVQHYSALAYMGIVPVLLHLPTILRGMRECCEDIVRWQPDVLILVDYPGFNLKVARTIKDRTNIPIFYYIAPKLWAWKEYRIKSMRRYVDRLYSILPFEVPFFEQKHHYPIDYVGNPTVDEVATYSAVHPVDAAGFRQRNGLDERPIIALLAGSRKQEIRDNLARMAEAAQPFARDYQLVLAAAPSIDDAYYREQTTRWGVRVVREQTYPLLLHSTAALVTSGTATLETALFRVPQVVCYYMKAGRLAKLGQRLVLKIPFVSLVNLVAEREVVPELVASDMTPEAVRRHLASILPGGEARDAQLQGYADVARRLGNPGAPQRAAQLMTERLREMKTAQPNIRTQNS